MDTQYDNMGRVLTVSNPYRRIGLDPLIQDSPVCGTHIVCTQNEYDSAGRPWKVITPDGAVVETLYSLSISGEVGTVVTVKDQALKERRSISNALGHLKRVDEPSGTLGVGAIASPYQPTTYSYDVLNNLLNVSQVGDTSIECGGGTSSCSQSRSFTYDAMARLKSAVNPESGTINYTYDANSNLLTKQDARSITTTYSYDTLNRVLSRTYSDGVTPTVSYFYDNLTNAKGKLIKVSSSVSTTEYVTFDVLGRVTRSKQTTDGVTYGNGSTDSAMTYTYNLAGDLIEQQYPSGRVVKNVLDSSGDLAVVRSKKNASAGYWNYADSFSYNAAGAVTSMQLGNGRWSTLR